MNSYQASTIERTRLWLRTLAASPGEGLLERQKTLLRDIFFSFRLRVAELVSHVAKDLPEFTVHDITHLDALWELADVVLGEEYFISPVEAFVFGGAVLLHDSALSISGYPDGLDGLKRSFAWRDGVVAEFRARGLSDPDEQHTFNPPHDIFNTVLSSLLRSNHASQAELLASEGWKRADAQGSFFLIENPEARIDLGPLIGRIAHSHWWDLNRVESEFSREQNPPEWCRYAGQIRPMVLAGLLRCADAIHLDSRRAPYFRRALVRPTAESARHWSFQERLMPPTRKGDAVYFTSRPFPESEHSAWWLCYDTLRAANSELEGVHALLADHQLPTFGASRVHSVHNISQFSQLIPTSHWSPVDTQIQVSNIPQMILELGGNALYRRQRWAVLRELIQNAADAVRARRAIENRSETWGVIEVSTKKEQANDSFTLTVLDSGLGMTEFVIRTYLLNFFRSYWNSPDAVSQFHGHLQRFKATGKYGIGFFSVFTIAKRVHIRTKSILDNQNITRVLAFDEGLNARPLLRVAKGSENLNDPGTEVKIEFLSQDVADSLLQSANAKDWPELLRFVAPALDIQVTYRTTNEHVVIIEPNDWVRINPQELLTRINPRVSNFDTVSDHKEDGGKVERFRHLARSLTDIFFEGTQVGRFSIADDFWFEDDFVRSHIGSQEIGALVCGGLRVDTLKEFVGLLEGQVEDASRNHGFVSVDVLRSGSNLKRIEDNIARSFALVDRQVFSDTEINDVAMNAAQFLHYLGVEPRELFVAWHQQRGYLRIAELGFIRDFDALYLVTHRLHNRRQKELSKEELEELIRKSDYEIHSAAFDWSPADTADNVLVIPFGMRQESRASDIYYIGQYDRLVTDRETNPLSAEALRLQSLDQEVEDSIFADSRRSYRLAGVALVGAEVNRLWGGTDDNFRLSIEYLEEVEIPRRQTEPIVGDAFLLRRII